MNPRVNISVLALMFAWSLIFVISVPAAPVTLTMTGFGYNTINGSGNGYDGQPGAIGCGPTSGAMILNYYYGLSDPLASARAMGSSTYMDVDLGGFGLASKFQFALEAYAHDHGQNVNATLHLEPSTYNAASWQPPYSDADLALDAGFWNTSTWDVNDGDFLNFVKTYIDAGNPLVATVDSDGWGVVDSGGFYNGTDHWMVVAGYDLDTGQWAGFNTWDFNMHWYDVTSAFHIGGTPGSSGYFGNEFGIGYLRTFEYLGPIDDGTSIPEPSSLFLLGGGLCLIAARINRLRS